MKYQYVKTSAYLSFIAAIAFLTGCEQKCSTKFVKIYPVKIYNCRTQGTNESTNTTGSPRNVCDVDYAMKSGGIVKKRMVDTRKIYLQPGECETYF